ncbi:MAG TPA: hypothetical protein VK742_14645 [Candidatus Sulfotelmatobacter sp.]|jgi:hypothetical protein|nr:hypothetical protein [Candidatus Sulfotelmatobacter sp.]
MDLFSLEKKIRQLRGDDSGSVLLLSGMMAFVMAIMVLYSLDTSQVIYNRITSQNAADSAAETAALWQARGLNVIQQLNDFHYVFNETLFGVEFGELTACVGADTAVIKWGNDVACCASLVGAVITGGSCCEAIPGDFKNAQSLCNICKQAIPENQYQVSTAKQILDTQQLISEFWPALEVVFASQAAQQSGADPALNAIPSWMGGAVSKVLPVSLPISMPSLPNLPSALTPYALPMTSVSLNVEQKPGKYWPWRWSFLGPNFGYVDELALTDVAAPLDWGIGEVACSLVFVFLSPQGDIPGSLGGPWGWKDSYYIGHPGYMTWVAGKTNEMELAGLGKLAWLNPSSSPPAEVNYWLGQSNVQMFNASAAISSSTLQIPAVIGLASSQVEGTGVTAEDESLVSELGTMIDNLTSKDSASGLSGIAGVLGPLAGMVPIDSKPHLIGVYLPGNTAGTTYKIYH